MVSGSQIGPRPLKSPARTAADGTEKVRVSDRRMRSPSKLPKKKARFRTQRTAERAAELILPQRRRPLPGRLEVVGRVERVVAVELEEAAADGVRAGARHHVDQRRRLAAELRRVHRLLNLELFDRVDRRIDHQVVEQFVRDLGAVEQVDVVARALAADVGQRARLLQRFASCAARRDDDGVAQLRQRQQVAAVDRQLDDLAVLDDVADLGGRRLQEGRVGLDLHRFRDPEHPERELDVERAAHLEHDGEPPGREGSVQRRHQVPASDAKRREKEPAFTIGHARHGRAAVGMRRGHGRVGNRRPRDVADDAGNLSGVDLRGRGGRGRRGRG